MRKHNLEGLVNVQKNKPEIAVKCGEKKITKNNYNREM